jgi:hypothetical protein
MLETFEKICSEINKITSFLPSGFLAPNENVQLAKTLAVV